MALLLAGCALAAALACGCVQLPAGQEAGPAEEVQLPYNAGALEDGALRVFYGDSSSTVLHGSTVLYQGSATDTINLLEDASTGEAAYYMVTSNQVGGSRTARLYDGTGALVYDCGDNCTASWADGKLILSDYRGFEAMPGDYHYRIVDLATGTETALPQGTENCFADGAGHFAAVVRQTQAAEDEEVWVSYSQMLDQSTTIVYDSGLREIARFEHCRGWQPYGGFNGEGAGWIALEYSVPDGGEGETQSQLYCPATGETMDEFRSICGRGVICTGREDSGYQVRRLADGAVLGEYAWPCERYLPQVAVLWRSGSDYGYEAVFADAPDTPRRVENQDWNEDAMALLLEDGALRVYDNTARQAGLLYEVQPELPAGTVNVTLWIAGDQSVELLCYDGEYDSIATCFYGPEGLLYRMDNGAYQNCYYLADTPDGPLFSASYAGPGGSTLVDVIDVRGKVQCSGLAYAYQNSTLPEGCFSARRGFLTGWMDASGEWVYCESIFRSLGDEDGRGYYW